VRACARDYSYALKRPAHIALRLSLWLGHGKVAFSYSRLVCGCDYNSFFIQ